MSSYFADWSMQSELRPGGGVAPDPILLHGARTMTVSRTRVTRTVDPRRTDATGVGLRYGVCTTLEQVVAAWELVYRCYLRAGMITSNHAGVHTLRRLVAPRTVVINGAIDRLTVSTLTACLDDPAGLPADELFADEVNALRRAGRVPFELGLFADRRERLFRSIDAMLELSRFAVYFGLSSGATDALMTSSPEQVTVLNHLFGFEPIGSARPDPRLNGRPVVLVRLDWQAQIKTDPPFGGLAYFQDRAIGTDHFADRFNFDPAALAGSSLAQFAGPTT
ncbi:MAG: hypothetical protein GC162_16385 [Planctomycetes bacterium]|nr:hypothetical protein [Planctomycetota bacterium]